MKSMYYSLYPRALLSKHIIYSFMHMYMIGCAHTYNYPCRYYSFFKHEYQYLASFIHTHHYLCINNLYGLSVYS